MAAKRLRPQDIARGALQADHEMVAVLLSNLFEVATLLNAEFAVRKRSSTAQVRAEAQGMPDVQERAFRTARDLATLARIIDRARVLAEYKRDDS